MQDAIQMLVVFGAFAIITKIITDTMTRHRIINKGLVDENVKYLFQNYGRRCSHSNIKWGMVLIGIGIAVLVRQLAPYSVSDEMMVGLMFLFAGIAFLIYYPIAKKQDEPTRN
jgi:uncharacterized membrane protein